MNCLERFTGECFFSLSIGHGSVRAENDAVFIIFLYTQCNVLINELALRVLKVKSHVQRYVWAEILRMDVACLRVFFATCLHITLDND